MESTKVQITQQYIKKEETPTNKMKISSDERHTLTHGSLTKTFQ